MDKRRPFVPCEHYSTYEEKQQFLRRIFDDTARYYEGIARWGWFGAGDAYRRNVLRRIGVTEGMRAIDVASGTGPVARALLSILKDPDAVVCVEPSAGMIAESKKTVPSRHIQSTAESLPVPDESFDVLTMGFALRHVDDLEESFREFRRVLKPGGKALIMDVTLPDNPVGLFLFRAYFKHILPSLTLVFSWDRKAYQLMRYYWDTMEHMTPREEVTEYFKNAGFTKVTHKVLLGCFSEYLAER